MMRIHEDWLLTPQRAALHEPTGTLVIADVHLGYGRSRQTRGDAVPEVLVADDLAPLADLASMARRLLIAGDLFEAGYEEHLADQLTTWCHGVGLELLGLVPGNHDRLVAERPGLALHPEGFLLGKWRILHGDRPLPSEPCVQGHEHPCLRVSGRVQAPCYLVGPDRLVLPAFSPEAAGVGVIGDRRWAGFRCLAIVGDEILDFGDPVELRARLNGHDPWRVGSPQVVGPERSKPAQ